MSSVWGKILQISIFGESHGECVGGTIHNFPAGTKVDFAEMQSDLALRKGGKANTTARIEADIPNIISGVKNEITTGAPITILFNNANFDDSCYEKSLARPSTSDYTNYVRYCGHNDVNGSGHSSGRLTAPIVALGSLVKTYLKTKNINLDSQIFQIGNLKSSINDFEKKTNELLHQLKIDNDSIGGSIITTISGVKVGFGSPIFDNVESIISSMLFAIPGVKAVEFGLGCDFAMAKGSEVNDQFLNSGLRTSNFGGGIEGGITNGMPIVVKTTFKPTASIGTLQDCYDIEDKTNKKYAIVGKHDPCIAVRAVVAVNNAIAIALGDIYLQGEGYAREF